MKSNVAHRRKLRAIEAKRDKLIENAAKTKTDLAKTRAELKALRRAGGQ